MPAPALSAPQTARATLRAGPVEFTAKLRTTPLGLLTIGGLVSLVLLSIPPIIRAGAGAASLSGRRPTATPDR